MPTPTLSYISNMATRYLLKNIGEDLGYDEFIKKKDWGSVLKHFGKKCCYCGVSEKKVKRLEADHIVGFNKSELGLDCIGNIAPACPSCNQRKGRIEGSNGKYSREVFLDEIAGDRNVLKERRKKIFSHMKKNNYPPDRLHVKSRGFKRQ